MPALVGARCTGAMPASGEAREPPPVSRDEGVAAAGEAGERLDERRRPPEPGKRAKDGRKSLCARAAAPAVVDDVHRRISFAARQVSELAVADGRADRRHADGALSEPGGEGAAEQGGAGRACQRLEGRVPLDDPAILLDHDPIRAALGEVAEP